MAYILSWQSNELSAIVIRHLTEGRCVVLPTESTYEIVASALNPAAATTFGKLATANQAPAIVLFDYAELFDWLPLLRGAGARLFRKLGPGSIVLRAEGGYRTGLWARLPSAIQALSARDQRLAVRWPDHPAWSELRQAGLPLVTMAIPGAVTAEETARLLGDQVACIIDAAATKLGGVPTVARIDGRRCLVEQPSLLNQEQIDALTVCRTLFLCTGNTCRSPLAEALCLKMLAERCGCLPEDLPQHGFLVQSAGLAAMRGGEASEEGVRVAADLGADLSRHRSRMVTMEMLLWADHLFAMTAGHCYSIESIGAAELPQVRLISPDGHDIADPIGGERADYRACAMQILACLQQRLPELLES
jgi:L-threonylcarbamoyladenylate synthase